MLIKSKVSNLKLMVFCGPKMTHFLYGGILDRVHVPQSLKITRLGNSSDHLRAIYANLSRADLLSKCPLLL